MTGQPLIGVTTYSTRARWGAAWNRHCSLLPTSYMRYVQRAGGLTVLLPPDNPALAGAMVERLDGLVLAGGEDVDPALYGEQPHPRTDAPVPERDRWELALLAAALERGVPLLGICRGMQLMNVQAGGTLNQHLPETVGHKGHNPRVGTFPDHLVEPVQGTVTGHLMPTPCDVATHHHQGVGRLGTGLIASAHAEDGTVEALEHPWGNGCFAIGVQWHPEMRDDLRLVRGLVEMAGRRRGSLTPRAAASTAPAAPCP
ncbi:gamma-glutamyl-gamma-aminobutyrate hydrolase family protein [Streptomyces sp. AV19]|uniref:gamma-glutamyl-gamma-aminobutyrate hydrolase family protein n=1 Tax=Streptomyces sp. AV19 TaxID=2793068 RepID=UPI001F2EE345|nr:gamma-glutamyl-gamma-aminobutyrate hydrolase family protein [Streptomyces sp. AV19]MDG4532768.1 gamma-glutamyl-gamma-aminobutyrate hydrolase family protein [Streptomyces sp. AV19]